MTKGFGFMGTLFDVNLYYSFTDSTASPAAGNTWETTTSVNDVKLGYIMANRWYWGVLYSVRNDNQISLVSATGNSAGAGLGYFSSGGFNWRAYYKFNESSGVYSEGKGFQFDVGYSIIPTPNMYLGFALSHRQTTYEANSSDPLFTSASRSETYPFISLGFIIY